MKWESHIDFVSNKLRKNIYVLRGLSRKVSLTVLRSAYFSLCQSVMSYAILLWGLASSTHRIFALQRRALRIISMLKYRDNCKEAFIQQRILTFPSLYILENLTHVKRNLNNFERNNGTHLYNTRHGNDLRTPFFRLTKCQKGPNFIATKFYNKIPNIVKELPEKCLNLE